MDPGLALVGDYPGKHAAESSIHAFLRHLVALKPPRLVRRRVVGGFLRLPFEMQNRPFAVRRHGTACCKIDDPILRYHRCRRDVLNNVRLVMPVVERHVPHKRLQREVRHAHGVRRQFRHCKNRDSALVRLRDDAILALDADVVLHRLLGLDPRPAGTRPPRAVVHAHLQAQPLRFLPCEEDEIVPFVGKRLHRAVYLRPVADIEKRESPKPLLLHGLQIGRDSIPPHISVHPVPPGPGPRRHGRIAESVKERILSFLDRLRPDALSHGRCGVRP